MFLVLLDFEVIKSCINRQSFAVHSQASLTFVSAAHDASEQPRTPSLLFLGHFLTAVKKPGKTRLGGIKHRPSRTQTKEIACKMRSRIPGILTLAAILAILPCEGASKDPATMKLKELRQLLADRGVDCVGYVPRSFSKISEKNISQYMAVFILRFW